MTYYRIPVVKNRAFITYINAKSKMVYLFKDTPEEVFEKQSSTYAGEYEIENTETYKSLELYHEKYRNVHYSYSIGWEDENDNLIYLGDIIQLGEEKYRVASVFNGWVLEDINDNNKEIKENQFQFYKSKIIGNIYENPELLEKSNK